MADRSDSPSSLFCWLNSAGKFGQGQPAPARDSGGIGQMIGFSCVMLIDDWLLGAGALLAQVGATVAAFIPFLVL